MIKQCKRTASVRSKDYSTCAEYSKSNFYDLITTYPYLKESMERHCDRNYNDKWKKFMRKILRNIDYLSYNISENVIDELIYMWELIIIKEETYLFKSGKPWESIYLIASGDLSVYMNNNGKDTYLETLYTGCTIGAYGALHSEEYTMSGKAKTDMAVIVLPFSKLQKLRANYEELDKILTEYETYCDENGLPYWDYKLYRKSHLSMTPIEKFRHGINRISRILRSYKSTAFSDLMKIIKERIK